MRLLVKPARLFLSVVLLCTAAIAGVPGGQSSQQAPPKSNPSTATPPASGTNQSAVPGTAPAQAEPPKTTKPNRAAAYYHYSMAHIYEELVALYGRSEFAARAIEEYKKAIANDPNSSFLNAGLAELYFRTARIRDAVTEAQGVIKRDPNNIEARKLLGRIYLRLLGDTQAGTQSQEMLRLALEQYEAIARINPNAVDDKLLLGRLYILNKEVGKAEEVFKSVVEKNPSSEEAVTTLAYLYNEQGQSEKAAQVLASVPDNARSAKLYSALGYTYEQQKNYKKAIEHYQRAVQIDDDNLDARRGLAQNLMLDGQLDAALEQYKEVSEADPQDAQAHMQIGEIYRRQSKYDDAVQSLKKAETLVQDSVEVSYKMGLVLEAQGKFDEAIVIWQRLLDRNMKADGKYSPQEANNRGVFLERLAHLYRQTGKQHLAVETYRKALTLGEENATRAYSGIIDTYRDMKNWPQATAVAQEALQKYPNDKNLKLSYAGQLADSGRSEEAAAIIKGMLKGTREDRDVLVAISNLYSRLRKWPEAEDYAKKAEELAQSQEEKQYVYFIQGSVYERQKKYDLAEERFRKVLAMDADNPNALNYLGYMLAERGVRLDEAVTLIKKALEAEPHNGAYLDSLGWAYYKQGKLDLAEEFLRKAITRSPNDATLHDHLADVYNKKGKLKEAVQHWERALEEWNKSVEAEREPADMARAQKKLEGARVKLARQTKE